MGTDPSIETLSSVFPDYVTHQEEPKKETFLHMSAKDSKADKIHQFVFIVSKLKRKYRDQNTFEGD